MYTELIWLFVVTGIATAQQEGPTKEPQTWSTVDTPLDEDTDAATDAVSKYLGFSCPKGYRCLPVIDCFPCDYGTWKDNDGSGLCEKCPPDCTTLRKGAQSREECVPFCPPGYERSQCGQTCTKCRPGTFKPSWNGTELCTKCPDGSNPAEDTIGLTDVEQCYDDGEDPRISSTDQTMSWSTPTETITHSGISTEDWTTVSGSTSTETTPVTKPNTNSDWFTQSWTMTTEDDCKNLCPLPPPSESQFCSNAVNQLFGCLNRCRFTNNRDVVQELNEARQSLHSAIKDKLTSILNEEPDWTAIFERFLVDCPGYSTTSMTETPTTTGVYSTSTSTSYETTDTLSTTTSTPRTTYSESSSTTTSFTTESSSTTTTATTTGTTSEEGISTTVEPWGSVACTEDRECGLRGKCNDGHCGCLTTYCSGIAYAAMPGCQYFCQCNEATNTWVFQPCAPGTVFDEMFPGMCNHPFNVETRTCYHAFNCTTDYCEMPTAAENVCDLLMRNYTRCLRSLYTSCGHYPVAVHTAQANNITNDVLPLFNEYTDLLVEYFDNGDVEQFYINYMEECFENDFNNK